MNENPFMKRYYWRLWRGCCTRCGARVVKRMSLPRYWFPLLPPLRFWSTHLCITCYEGLTQGPDPPSPRRNIHADH